LRSLNYVVDELLDCFSASRRFCPFVIIAFAAHTLSLKEHMAIGLLDNLDIYCDL
jgi:hypothetical protein